MKKKIIFPIIMLLLLMVATIGVTFAAFTFTKQGTVENIVESSTIMLTYTEGKTGILLNEAYPMSDETGKVLTGTDNVFDFTVQATLGKSNVISYEVSAIKIPITDMTPLEDNEVKLYLERAVDPDTTYQEVLAPTNFVPIENQREIGSPIGSMILDSGAFYTEGTTIHNYRLRLWVDENTKIPSGESRKYGVRINVYAKQDVLATPVESPKNDNITHIWKYDQTTGSSTFCVTGEEATCQAINSPKTYEVGTIIKYKVNDTEEKYFHVMSDNGDTLTLQQRENTMYTTAWHTNNDNTKGPLTILSLLENATNNWTNVLDQSYTLGTTIFKDNAYTGCDENLYCQVNNYILQRQTTKARLITIQEASSFGCLVWQTDNSGINNGSCPIWMYNYFIDSISFGGTANQEGEKNNVGYWTSSSYSPSSSEAWHVSHDGSVYHRPTSIVNIGARAVIDIKK